VGPSASLFFKLQEHKQNCFSNVMAELQSLIANETAGCLAETGYGILAFHPRTYGAASAKLKGSPIAPQV